MSTICCLWKLFSSLESWPPVFGKICPSSVFKCRLPENSSHQANYLRGVVFNSHTPLIQHVLLI